MRLGKMGGRGKQRKTKSIENIKTEVEIILLKKLKMTININRLS